MNDNFVKRRKFPKSLKRGTGGMNPCWRPSSEASKADRVEFHQEDMKLRRSRRRQLKPDFDCIGKTNRNEDPAWRNREFRR